MSIFKLFVKEQRRLTIEKSIRGYSNVFNRGVVMLHDIYGDVSTLYARLITKTNDTTLL